MFCKQDVLSFLTLPLGLFNGDEVKREMASTSSFSKFDPADHVGNVYDAFIEFVGSFDYE